MSNWYTQSKRSKRSSQPRSLRRQLIRLAKNEPRLKSNVRNILDGLSKHSSRHSSYDDWIKAVDRKIQQKAMISRLDLPDMPYRAWFDSGMSASAAASRAIEESGGGMFGF